MEAADSSQNTAIAALDGRLDALEGAGTGKTWIALPFLIRNAQAFTNLPAGPSQWTNTLRQKVSLPHAEKIFFWCHVGTAGAAGNYVRCQYTTDLTGNTGWTDISGADIPLDVSTQAGMISATVDIPSEARMQEFVLLRAVGGGGNGSTSPIISFFQPTALQNTTSIGGVASFNGRAGAVVAASGDYSTGQVTEVADKKFVTDAEKAKLANLPSDTNAALAGKADGAATTAALATKAPLASPGLTGSPTAPTPATGDNSTKIATTAFVKAQNYLTSVPPHTHVAADITGLQTTKAVLAVTNSDPVNLPDHDAVFIEHSGVNANVRIPASWTKKPHTLVFLGNPNTCNVAGDTGSGQTIKGAPSGGVTFASGTDVAAMTRTLIPDPDTTGFPNRWRIF